MRKHVLRAVLIEILVTLTADWIDLVLHWQGGDHTETVGPPAQERAHADRHGRRHRRD